MLQIYLRNSEISSEIVLALECTQEEADTGRLLSDNHAPVSGGGTLWLKIRGDGSMVWVWDLGWEKVF